MILKSLKQNTKPYNSNAGRVIVVERDQRSMWKYDGYVWLFLITFRQYALWSSINESKRLMYEAVKSIQRRWCVLLLNLTLNIYDVMLKRCLINAYETYIICVFFLEQWLIVSKVHSLNSFRIALNQFIFCSTVNL